MGIRVRVRVGYNYLGKGKVGYPAGTIFEDIDPKEIADQRWKFEDMPSRKTGETAGIGALNADNNSEILSNSARAAKEAEEKEAEDKEAAEELAKKEAEEAEEAQKVADKEAAEAEEAAKALETEEEKAPKEEKKGRAKRKKN